jgi:hypothetical protein
VDAQLVTATSDRASEGTAPASVTAVDPSTALGQPGVQLAPAIHIAASGPAVAHPVQVDVAQVLLDAYRSAVHGSPAACNLPVSMLAAIGEVESGSLVGRPIDARHRTSVLGPLLDGNGFAAIADTDNGRWDGSTRWDRAVGPMQFIPSTWRRFGVDGDGDGVADPQDIEDAAASTAGYLCFGGRDLSRPADVRAAILSYNHSTAYLDLVSTYQARYADLGLDDPASSGTPTTISLIATPVAAPVVGAPAATTTPTPRTRAVSAPAGPRVSADVSHTARAAVAAATAPRTGSKAGAATPPPTRTVGTNAPRHSRPTKPTGSTTPTGPTTPAGTPSPGGTGTPAAGGQTSTPGSDPTTASPDPTTGSTPPGSTPTADPSCTPAQGATGDQPAAGKTPAPADAVTPDAAECPPCDAPADPATSDPATTGGTGTGTAPSGGATGGPAAGDQTPADPTCAPVTPARAPSPSAAP